MRPLLLAPLLLVTAAAAPDGERRFMVPNFDRLRVDGPFEVEVVTGPPTAVAAGDRAALDQVAVRVDGGMMVVSAAVATWDSRVRGGATPAKVRVSVPALRSAIANGSAQVHIAEMKGTRIDLATNGSGLLEVGDVRADDLNANLSGTGTIVVAGRAKRAQVRAFGTGLIDAVALTADEARVVNESTGPIRIAVRLIARVSALASGAIEVAGTPECHVRGSGPVTCAGPAKAD